MSERGRNIAVGLTVIVGLCMLGTMIVIFTGLPEMLRPHYKVHVRFDSTHDAKEGDPVRLAGMRIGSILDVDFTSGDPRQGVTFTLAIDRAVRVPGNVTAYIHSRGFVGSGWIELRPEGPARTDLETGEEVPFLPTDRIATVQGSALVPGGIIPDEAIDAIKEMQKGFKDLGILAANLNRLITPLVGPEPAATQTSPTTARTTAPTEGITPLLETIARFGRTLDDLHAVIGDEENQANLKLALARFSEAADQASETMTAMESFAEEARATVKQVSETTSSSGRNIERLTAKLMENAESVSRLTASLNRAVAKLESGDGSAGRLLNDSKLYNNLAEAADQMDKLLSEMRQLIRHWRSSGVKIRVK